MKVVAKRDDGALLVVDGEAAAIVADDRAWVLPRDSALARGDWEPDSSDTPVAAVRVRRDLLELRQHLAGQQSLR